MTGSRAQTERAGVALFRPQGILGSTDQSLVLDLKALGFEVFEFPLLKHELTSLAPPNPPKFYSAYLFSSAMAIEALTLQSEVLDFSKPVLAVGEQTRRAALKFGFTNVQSGSAGMVELIETKLDWLISQTDNRNVLYIGVSNPKHLPSDPQFQNKLSQATHLSFGEFEFDHWPVYQTLPLPKAKVIEDLFDNMPKIECFSFFSTRNATVFKSLLKADNVYSANLSQSLRQLTLVCNSRDVADVFKSDDSSSLFQTVEISETPSRKAYLALMKNRL